MLLRPHLLRRVFLPATLLVSSVLPQIIQAQIPSDAVLSKKVVATAAPAPLLPESFAGYELENKLDKTTEPGVADAANAQVLVEDGFRDFASGTYKSNGNTLT